MDQAIIDALRAVDKRHATGIISRKEYREIIGQLQAARDQITGYAAKQNRPLYATEGDTIREIDRRLTAATQGLAAYERTGEAYLETHNDEMRARRVAEQELHDRRQARYAEYHVGIDKLDRAIDQVQFDTPLPHRTDQRRILAGHLAELEKRQELSAWIANNDAALDETIAQTVAEAGGQASPSMVRAEILSQASIAFRTTFYDETTQRHFLIETNANGKTFLDFDPYNL